MLFSSSFFQLVLFTLLFLGVGLYFLFTHPEWVFLPLLAIWSYLLLRFQFIIFPAGKELELAYAEFYYEGATLKNLCEKPISAMGSSNLQTGRPFSFSCYKMSDSTDTSYSPLIHFLHENFPVARAVAASSCAPFGFSPVSINKEYFKVPADYGR